MTGNCAVDEVRAPSVAELFAALGRSASAWPSIVSGLEERFSPLELEWQTTSLTFGRMCVLRSRGRVLAYLTPMAGQLLVGVVLDEKAYAAAQGSALREAIKKMLSDTPPTREGRGIRFVVKTSSDVAQVLLLAECIMADGEHRYV